MNRNKEYRLKRKAHRKDYIIQDKNLTIKTLYYRNETKRNKIDQLQQENKQLKEVIEEVREYIEETISYKEILARDNWEYRVKTMLEILDKVKGE